MLFEDLPLSEDILDALYDMHFEECTPVQEQCIPPLLEGRDVIGIAQTGTGKTAAYLLPLLTLLERENHPGDAVNILVMAPTRELARQIDQALEGFGYYMKPRGVAIYGGNDGIRYEAERRALSQGADIVIATPGRLLTHIDLGTLDLSRTTHLVLDEADRMLDMGFSDDILRIVAQMPPKEKRQTVLFSATMPDKITALAKTIMHRPVEVRIAVSKPAEKIAQSVYLCREGDKDYILRRIFEQKRPKRVILFASKKTKAKELHILLKRAGFNVEAMHSDLDQPEREQVMLRFKAGQTDILAATDIVSRGIDIDDVSMVVNYDCPRDPEDYVHRIGRTARAGRDGQALTLVGERDMPLLQKIERLLEEKVPRAELPDGLRPPTSGEIARAKDNARGRGARRGGHRRRGRGRPRKA
ncbi:MAG: DEAD/DEAH box helicase [Bacteroidaceae bacterium]|nr:DEAD/DEAH box helicase [Bacteroidaceae bacterium]